MKKSPKLSLVDRDSATRRARRLGVECDVGELCFDSRSVRNREAVPALSIFSGTRAAMVGVCKFKSFDGEQRVERFCPAFMASPAPHRSFLISPNQLEIQPS